MTGISEILVLVLLIASVLILPRLFKSQPANKKTRTSPLQKMRTLSVKARISIFLTLLYPSLTAVYFRPWEETNQTLYIFVGIVPVVVVWSIVWIWGGRKIK